MDYKMISVWMFAVACSYLIFSMPMAFASEVKIYNSGGQVSATTQISPSSLVNKQVVILHDESDSTWTNTKISIRVSKADSSVSVKKIYLYKCKKLSPSACINTIPESFDNRIDTDFDWSMLSEQESASSYPQVANIFVLVKLEGSNSRVMWMGFWDTIKRLDYNIFNVNSNEINSIDVFAKSDDLVQPIKSYISNFRMVPMNWVSKVVFGSATTLYGASGSQSDMNTHTLEPLETQSNQISSINKDFYLIFPNISNGVGNAVALNKNPSFTCGDGSCDADLGETNSNCCFDCGCSTSQYCDITTGNAGGCKADSIGLSVTGYVAPAPLGQCSSPMTVNITARISNPPTNLPPAISGFVRVNNTQYTVSCTGAAGTYTCPLSIQPPVRCGFGSFSLSPNTLNMSISYRDGPNTAYKDLSTQFSAINVNYDCGCAANNYCDIGPNVCRLESQIGFQVMSFETPLINFLGANDVVKSTVRIFNPPTNFTTNSFTFAFGNLSWEGNSAPMAQVAVNCNEVGSDASSRTFNCSIPLTVPNYDNSKYYVIRGNRANASITFTDGGVSKTRELTTAFGDVVIPQQSCGNGRVDPREDQINCCRDAGCPSAGQWCDIQNGCRYIGNITATVLNADPLNVSDCTIPHMINVTMRINSAPSDAVLNYYAYLSNNVPQSWNVQCGQPSQFTGIVTCYVTMPPQQNCTLPYVTISGNSLNISMSYRNGDGATLVREISAPFGDINIKPAWHCGNRVCESGIGESASNCCIDCPCGTSPDFGSGYYCNYDPENIANGSCEAKSNINLVIDRPTSPVRFTKCEDTNAVNIKAHIDNQPVNANLENIYANVNGEDAEVFCEQDRVFVGEHNFTLNCTLRVPAEPECTQGKEYLYSNNSIGMFISYRDGLGKVVTQSLSRNLVDFSSKQTFRSLHDIVTDAVSKIQANLYKSLDIQKKLLKWIKMCLEIMLVMAIMEIAFTAWVAFGMPGAGAGASSKIGGSQWGQNVMAAGTISQGLNSIWGNICNMIKEFYDIQSKTIQIENEIIKMETCIAVYQHQLDSGYCKTTSASGSSCFNSLTGCVNYGAINSYMNDIGTSVNKMATYNTNIGKSIVQIGEGLNQIGLTGGGAATLSVLQNKALLKNGSIACNRYAGSQSAYSNYKDELNVVTIASSGCKHPIVKFGRYDAPNTGDSSLTTSPQPSFSVSIDTVTTDENWRFELYCFSSADDYLNAANDAQELDDAIKYSKDVTVMADNNNDGICSEAGETTSTPRSQAGDTRDANNIKTNIERAKTFIERIRTMDNNAEVTAIIEQLDDSRRSVSEGDYSSAKLSLEAAARLVSSSGTLTPNQKTTLNSHINTAWRLVSNMPGASSSTGSSSTGGTATVYGCCFLNDIYGWADQQVCINNGGEIINSMPTEASCVEPPPSTPMA